MQKQQTKTSGQSFTQICSRTGRYKSCLEWYFIVRWNEYSATFFVEYTTAAHLTAKSKQFGKMNPYLMTLLLRGGQDRHSREAFT